jgi:hypothetical protein
MSVTEKSGLHLNGVAVDLDADNLQARIDRAFDRCLQDGTNRIEFTLQEARLLVAAFRIAHEKWATGGIVRK